MPQTAHSVTVGKRKIHPPQLSEGAAQYKPSTATLRRLFKLRRLLLVPVVLFLLLIIIPLQRRRAGQPFIA